MRADETGIGPVGFAETISTWTRSRRSAPPPPYAVPVLEDLGERRREPLVAEEEVDEARAGDLGALDHLERRRPPRAISAAISRGGRRRAPASRSATFVA